MPRATSTRTSGRNTRRNAATSAGGGVIVNSVLFGLFRRFAKWEIITQAVDVGKDPTYADLVPWGGFSLPRCRPGAFFHSKGAPMIAKRIIAAALASAGLAASPGHAQTAPERPQAEAAERAEVRL